MLWQQTAEVVDVVVPAAYCRDAFSGQSSVEMGIEAGTLGRFSPAAALYYEMAVCVLGKRNMQEGQGQVIALADVVLVLAVCLARLSQLL